MAMLKQNADGSSSFVRERDGQELSRVGGLAGPAVSPAGASYVPSVLGKSILVFNILGGTDTAGGILGWTNNLGYDIIVTNPVLHVTTQSSGACGLSVGQTATTITTLSSNMFSSQACGSAGVFTPATPVSVLVKQNEFITASKGSGASAALVARLYLSFFPANGTANAI